MSVFSDNHISIFSKFCIEHSGMWYCFLWFEYCFFIYLTMWIYMYHLSIYFMHMKDFKRWKYKKNTFVHNISFQVLRPILIFWSSNTGYRKGNSEHVYSLSREHHITYERHELNFLSCWNFVICGCDKSFDYWIPLN